MRSSHTKLLYSALIFASTWLTACGGGGGGGGTAAPTTTYTVGGTISGLSGTVVLQNNGGNNLTLSTSGNFTFTTALANSASYTITVLTQPTGQTCSVNPVTGTVAGANITNVAVTCAAGAYTIGGTISGLTASGLVLRNNSGNDLTVASGATAFTFSAALANGSAYAVTVLTQPTGRTCTLSANTGTVSGANISNVSVSCATAATTYTVGGNVTGLTGTLVLQDLGGSGDTRSITSDGNFTLPTPHASGYLYWATVKTQPAGQTCTPTSNIGTISAANVTGISVTCSANNYTIGGTIFGLSATGLVLRNNGGNDLTVVSGATAFTFSPPIANGAAYAVTVLTQPTGKTCTVNAPSGTVAGANVTSVAITCSSSTYSVGGSTITNLLGSGLVLQNNGGDDKAISFLDTPYAFATKLASGSAYNVTVKTQPTAPAQVCTVAMSSSTVASANVTNVNISCVNAYTIGGTITGAAAGSGPILQNNLGDNLYIPTVASGTPTNFIFSTPIANGATYSVTQLTRAKSPAQDCSAIAGGSNNNGSGTVGTSSVSSVAITCTLSTVTPPKFAYVTNSTSNTVGLNDTVSAYTIASSGVLAATTPPTTLTGDGPFAVAVDSTGQFAFLVNSNADSISGYSINPVSGVLTSIDTNGAVSGVQPTIPTGVNPVSIAIHPSGKFAYVANQVTAVSAPGSISAYSINTTSGALTAIDADGATADTQATIATGLFPYAVTLDPLGRFAYVANNNDSTISAYTINSTGALTPAPSPVTVGTNPRSVAIDPTGKCALVANAGSDNVMSYNIDQTTGALTGGTTAPAITGSAPRAVAIDPNAGLYAYVANAGAVSPPSLVGSVSAFSISLSTCGITAINADAVTSALTIAAGTVPLSVNIDPSGRFVYVANFGSDTISVYSINTGTGALTLLATEPTDSGPTSVTTTQ